MNDDVITHQRKHHINYTMVIESIQIQYGTSILEINSQLSSIQFLRKRFSQKQTEKHSITYNLKWICGVSQIYYQQFEITSFRLRNIQTHWDANVKPYKARLIQKFVMKQSDL